MNAIVEFTHVSVNDLSPEKAVDRLIEEAAALRQSKKSLTR